MGKLSRARWSTAVHLAGQAMTLGGARKKQGDPTRHELVNLGRCAEENNGYRTIGNPKEAFDHLGETIDRVVGEYTQHPLRGIADLFCPERMGSAFMGHTIVDEKSRARAAVAFAIFNPS